MRIKELREWAAALPDDAIVYVQGPAGHFSGTDNVHLDDCPGQHDDEAVIEAITLDEIGGTHDG
jgi:hypothetical protein